MPQDIFSQLMSEHDEMKSLMSALQENYSVRTFEKVTNELTTHMEAEEEVLYRHIRDSERLRQIVMEGYEEHHAATLVLRELQRNGAGTERWMAKFKVLSELVEHHIQEEEEHMFPQARTVIGERAKELGDQYMKERKRVLAHA